MNPMGRTEYILTHLYCGACMRWISIESALWEGSKPTCPFCGKILRIRSRKPGSEQLKQLKHYVVEHYIIHHRVPDFKRILVKKK